MTGNHPNTAASTNHASASAADAARPVPVPGFLVAAFTGLVIAAGVSLVAVPVLTVGAVHAIVADDRAAPRETTGGGAAAAAPAPTATVAAAPAAAAGPSAAELGALRMLPAGDAEQGADHFQAYCVACHGADGKGKPNLGKDLVHSKFVAAQNDPSLIAFIKRGRGVDDPLNTTKVPMPPKAGNPAFTDGEINDVVAYLRKLQKEG